MSKSLCSNNKTMNTGGGDVEPAPAGREGCHPVILSSAAWERISASFPRFFGTVCAMTERARPVTGPFGAKPAAIYSIFRNTGAVTERGPFVTACHRPLRCEFRLVFGNTKHNDRMTE